ncbi:hypothetical protein V8F06_014011 [Rhypophila decipiens]
MEPLSPDPSVVVGRYFHTKSDEMGDIHEMFSGHPSPPHKAESWSHSQPKIKRQAFLQELDEFNRKLDQLSRSRRHQIDFDVRDCEWAKVFDKLVEAKETVARRLERDKTWLSKGGIVLTKMSNMFQPVLQAIPDELCFLHGGLALVLHLAKGRDKIKGEIINVFEDVMYAFAAAGNAAEHTSGDIGLIEELDRLRLSLFKTIPTLIDILLPGNIVRTAVAPFRTAEAQPLLETLGVDIKRVNQRAKIITDHLHSDAAKITKDHVEEIHDSVRDLHVMQQDIFDRINESLAGQDGLAKMLSDAVKVFHYHRTKKSRRGRSSPGTRENHSAGTPDFKSVATLLLILDTDHHHLNRDLHFVRRQSKEFDLQSKHAAAAIFKNTNFHRWMTSDDSDLLHIEGRLDGCYGKTSPISYFCATFVDKMQNMPPQAHTLVLNFFCGQHVASNDPLRGPRGLLRALVAQSLRPWDHISLDELDLGALGGPNHDAISTSDLCALLHFVIRQIPVTCTVYCVIDNVNQLEREEWADDFWFLMGTLGNIVAGEGGENLKPHARFKVIITSPGRSQWLRGDQAVNVNNHVLVGDRG